MAKLIYFFLQDLLEWHFELHFIFSKDICTFYQCSTFSNDSLQIHAYFQTLSLRLTEERVNLRTHHVPWWSCFQQLWIHCEHTAAQVGLPSFPTDKAHTSWHQRRLIGHFWGLDVLDQVQAPRPQRLSQYRLLEVLSWREKPFFELVVPDQILHLLAQCWFDSYTEVASDFQSETLTIFTVTSKNSVNKLVTHWTLGAPDDSTPITQ